MISRTLRMGLAASTVVGAMLVAPPKSEAIFHWFRNCFRPRTTVAMPVVGASACDPCATQQVVQYVPQVAYRTEIVNVPVTTYRPVTSCGPCGPVTTYRPVVTYRPTTRVVPYTTYRPVVTTARRTLRLMPTVSLMPSTTTTLYAPATSYAPAASSACCGGSTAAATSYATPSYASPSYATPSYSSGTTYQNGTTTSPTPAPSSGSTYATPAPSSSSSSGTQETPRPSLRPQTGTSNGYEGSGSRSSNQSLRPIPNQNAPAASQPAAPAQQQQPQPPQQLNNGNGENNQDRTGGAGPYFAPPASSRTTMQPEGWTRNYSPVNWTAARPVAVQQAPAPRQTVAPSPTTRPAIDDSGWQPVRPRP